MNFIALTWNMIPMKNYQVMNISHMAHLHFWPPHHLIRALQSSTMITDFSPISWKGYKVKIRFLMYFGSFDKTGATPNHMDISLSRKLIQIFSIYYGSTLHTSTARFPNVKRFNLFRCIISMNPHNLGSFKTNREALIYIYIYIHSHIILLHRMYWFWVR